MMFEDESQQQKKASLSSLFNVWDGKKGGELFKESSLLDNAADRNSSSIALVKGCQFTGHDPCNYYDEGGFNKNCG